MSTATNHIRFKKLTISDQKVIMEITKSYKCFSDFNFTSMFVYNTEDSAEFAILNNNLLLKFNDYISGEPFYTFLGKNKISKTIKLLMELSKKNGVKPVLKLVPEDNFGRNFKNICSKYNVSEDIDNFDYHFSVERISILDGADFETQRNMVSRFKRRVESYKVELLDIKNPLVKDKIVALFELWMKNKSGSRADAKHEYIAVKRMLDHSDCLQSLIVLGLFHNDDLIAFSVNEVVDNETAIAHFRKADVKYPGIFQFLEHESAKEILKRGCKVLNFEQDLGIEGLRKAKLSWRPIGFLKKYTISEKN